VVARFAAIVMAGSKWDQKVPALILARPATAGAGL